MEELVIAAEAAEAPEAAAAQPRPSVRSKVVACSPYDPRCAMECGRAVLCRSREAQQAGG